MKSINSPYVEKIVVNNIRAILDSIGIMYRIFSRSKDSNSLNIKLNSDSEYGVTKKIQDLIGVRIVLYFSDDISNVRTVLSNEFKERTLDASIDKMSDNRFNAVRYNIVYDLGDELTSDLYLGDEAYRIDNTFELQIRTIFSEGWHEVEHDLRYKCKDDWNDFDVENRCLNGVYATLETSEWTMLKIFDDLSYSHYKGKNWDAMLRQKLRLRLQGKELDEDIISIFNSDVNIAKKFFRLNRNDLILSMAKYDFYYPKNMSNIIYFSNILFINDSSIDAIIPSIMKEEILDQMSN